MIAKQGNKPIKDYAGIINEYLTDFSNGKIKLLNDNGVVYLMAHFRQLIEQNNKKDQYKILNFYCDWTSHSHLDRNTIAKEIIMIIDAAIQKEINLPCLIDKICLAIKENDLKLGSLNICGKYNINNYLFRNKEIWKKIFGQLTPQLTNKVLYPDVTLSKKLVTDSEKSDYYSIASWLSGERGCSARWNIAVCPDKKFTFEKVVPSSIYEGGLFHTS